MEWLMEALFSDDAKERALAWAIYLGVGGLMVYGSYKALSGMVAKSVVTKLIKAGIVAL